MRKRLFGKDGSSGRGPLRTRVAEGSSNFASGSTREQSISFSEMMKRDWAAGLLSSRRVQEYCAGAALEGNPSPVVQALAAAGACGHSSQHAQRDIMRILGRPTGAPEFYYAKVPIKDGSGTQVEKLQPFLLPHETFAKLHAERPDFFELHVRGMQRELQSCWNMLLEHDFVRSNRFVNANKGKMALAVPLGLHGDAGAMSKEKSLLVLS